MKPHKHAELIKAWADGQAEVEYRYPKDDGSWSLWKDLTQCVFHDWYEYRIKPEPKPLSDEEIHVCKPERQLTQLDTQLHPQTKPLSDEEIKQIWYNLYPLSSSSYWDDKREGLAELKFARAIEERHGIK